MSFIRIKKVKGHRYAYLVENKWTNKGARQKVGKYLGRIYSPEKKTQKGLKEHLNIKDIKSYVKENDFKKIINDLVSLELHKHGIDNVYFGKQGNKVIALNQGFLCEHTLNALLSHVPDEDDGFKLAELITGAGIDIEQNVFIELFEKLKQETTAKQAQEVSKEFYY